jgi:hypothetical protein
MAMRKLYLGALALLALLLDRLGLPLLLFDRCTAWWLRVESHLLETPGKVFTWVPTREGLTSRYMQMEHLHSQLRAHNKTLRIVNAVSSHYKELPPVRLCDIFELPSTIECESASANAVVNCLPCVLDAIVPSQRHHVESFNVRAQYAPLVPAKSIVDLSKERCGLLFGHNFPMVRGAADEIPVVVKPRYKQLFERVLDNLGHAFRLGDYAVVHWRRGDQASKCSMQEKDERPMLSRDTSVNCGTASDLVDAVHTALNSSWPVGEALRAVETAVYVSTNEADPAQLQRLRQAGFKLLGDAVIVLPSRPSWSESASTAILRLVRKPRQQRLTSLEAFVVELQLMMGAKKFVGWGSTGVRPFVERERERRKSSN